MCSDKSRLWSWACAGLRLTVGTMFLLFGVYDVIWPDAATSGTTVDLRDYAVDGYFFGVGLVLILTSVSGAPTFIKTNFGFMIDDFGAGICVLFSGFVTTNAFQIGKYSTWVAIVAFASGLTLILSPLIKYCCGWEAPSDGASASEKAPLIGAVKLAKDAEAPLPPAAATTTGNNEIPEDAFGADK